MTLVVPALPGTVNLESDFLTDPKLGCLGSSSDEMRAASVAAPYIGVYGELPFAGRDHIASGLQRDITTTRPLPRTQLSVGMDPEGVGLCRWTLDDSSTTFVVETSYLRSLKDATTAIKEATQVAVPGADIGAADGNFSLDATSAAPNLSTINDAVGNFLSVLAQAGVPVDGGKLSSLMTTGFMP